MQKLLRQKKKQGNKKTAICLCFFTLSYSFAIFFSGYYTSKILCQEESVNKPVEKKQNTVTVQDKPALSSISSNVRTLSWPNWPAVAKEAPQNPFVFKGNNFIHKDVRKILLEPREHWLEEFIKIYKNRPDPVNMCGIRINHALALYVSVRKIQPSLVVESGINAGVSTYFIRKAWPYTKIISTDPEPKPICKQGERWIDKSNLTTYYTGDNFIDLSQLDIRKHYKEQKNPKILVFIDDHQHLVKRIPRLVQQGVKYVIVEDNYRQGEGSTNNDRIGTPKQMFSHTKGAFVKDGHWLFQNVDSYAEFPPLIPPIMAKASNEPRKADGGFMVASDKNTDIPAPILRPDLDSEDMKIYEEICNILGLDKTMVDRDSYLQFMNYNQIAFMELITLRGPIARELDIVTPPQ